MLAIGPPPWVPEYRKIEIANMYKNTIRMHENMRKTKKYPEKIVYGLVQGKEIKVDLTYL